MPIFFAAIWGAFLAILPSVVGRVLVALGIGVVTYTGLKSSLDWLQTQAVSHLQGLPAEALQLVAFMKVGECISIITSAIVARLLINGMQSDTMKRWVIK